MSLRTSQNYTEFLNRYYGENPIAPVHRAKIFQNSSAILVGKVFCFQTKMILDPRICSLQARARMYMFHTQDNFATSQKNL